MALNTNMQIKLLQAQPDQSETILSQFTGDPGLRNESTFYLPGEDGKWTKFLNLQSALRAGRDSMELVIFVEPAKASATARAIRYLKGLSDDAATSVFMLIGFGLVGILVAFMLFSNSILGFMVQYSGLVLGLATIAYISMRAARAGWPGLFGVTPAVFSGFALALAVYWGFDYLLDPEGGLFSVPRAELGQMLTEQIGALPALALSYSSTLLVVLRALGFAFTADFAASLLSRDEVD